MNQAQPPALPPESTAAATSDAVAQAGSTLSLGPAVDQERGRIFPCDRCGGELVFHIGVQSLKCPYCGDVKQIEMEAAAEVAEQDYHLLLERLQSRQAEQKTGEPPDAREVRCRACGGNVVFTGSLTSTACPWCGGPIQLGDVHEAEDRVAVDGILPFLVPREGANARLRQWVQTRWFAPRDFYQQGVEGRFNGVYLPYYTFDTLTANHYTGQRGDHYYVTVGTGKERRQERRTRWTSASGRFQRFFDDVLTLANDALPRWLTLELEPWPLQKCVPFNREMLAGFLARTYDRDLETGFHDAQQRIREALLADVRQRIGGDEQQVDSLNTHYGALTCKHLLLPVWLLTYRYHQHPYLVAVNAATGEVHGERPYSWVKIAATVLGALAAVGIVVNLVQALQ